MELRDLQRLVRKGEGLHLEFKLKANHPDKIMREVIAFANAEGGTLLVGIADDKTIKGLKFAEEDEYILKKAFEDYCKPTIEYDFFKIPVENNREVLGFHIHKGKRAAYLLEKPKAKKGIAYIRVEDKSIKASREMHEILRRQKKGKDIKFHLERRKRYSWSIWKHIKALL